VHFIRLVPVLVLMFLANGSAHAESQTPQVIGKGDPLLRELVTTRVSITRERKKPDTHLHDRLLAGPRADWIPTLRAILERPIVKYEPDMKASDRQLATDRMYDENFWRANAATLLGILHDEASIDKILAEQDGGYSLLPFGRLAVARAGRLLLDVHDPVRQHVGHGGHPGTELEIIQHASPALAASGSPVVRDALLAYGAQTREPCSIALILTSLPPSPSSIAFLKRAFLDGIAQSKPCDGNAVAWADVALLRWMRQQCFAKGVSGTALVQIDRHIALLGDTETVNELLPEVSTNGTPDDQEELRIYLAFAQQCGADVGCYVNALKSYKRPKPGSSKLEWFRMNKARAMVVQAHDGARAEALLGNKELYLASIFSSFCHPLEGLVSPAFAKSVEKLPYLGDDLRVRGEMLTFVNPWEPLLAPGVTYLSPATSSPPTN